MSQIINSNISVLKEHSSNNKYFDNITGSDYEQFKKSIQEDGILTPIIISADNTIINQ